jgi:hypothetical protein
LTQIGAAQRPAGQSPPSLIVTNSSSMAFSGPRGGLFSPARFEFRVSSTTGTVGYSIRTPSWLTASPTFGTTDTRGVTITLTVNANASRLYHSDRERQCVTSFARRVWTWRRVHERVERSGQYDQAGKADYPRISSCDRTNRTQPWWRLLAGRSRRIPVGRPRWPFAGAVSRARVGTLSYH